MNYLVKSKNIYTERGKISGGFSVENGKIKQLFYDDNLPTNYDGQTHDYGDLIIIPGLIELHIHGFKGWSAMNPNKEEIIGLSKSLPSEGITAFTPTNHYDEGVFGNNKVISEVMSNNEDTGAKIIGIHMEGPFISKEKLGSVLQEERTEVDFSLMEQYIESSNDNIVTVTLAPELKNAPQLIDYLVLKGINVCIGHSNATYNEAIHAINRGARLSQKTGNCMRGMHHREMGVLGAVILDKRIYNEINSDFAHISKPFYEMIYRLKGYQKLCIVADEGVMSGLKKGKYNLPDRGEYYVGPDELLHLGDGTIDGSIHSMFYGLKNWVQIMNIPLEEAIVMASLNPAKVLGIDSQKGSILENKDADFVVIDSNFDIKSTYVEGIERFNKSKEIDYTNKEMYKYLVEEI